MYRGESGYFIVGARAGTAPKLGQLIAFATSAIAIAIPEGEEEAFLAAWKCSP